MKPRCLKERPLKLLQITRTEAKFRELKLEHAQDLGDARSDRDRHDFHTILGHDRRQDTIANAEVLQQCRVWAESLTNGIERYWLRTPDARRLCLRWRQLSQGPKKFLLAFLCQFPKSEEAFVGCGDLTELLDLHAVIVPIQLFSQIANPPSHSPSFRPATPHSLPPP